MSKQSEDVSSLNELAQLQLAPGHEFMDRIIKRQLALQDSMRLTPVGGVIVPYDGISLSVLPTVFRPLPETFALTNYLFVRPKERVLDVCTGSGVIAINAAIKGAQSVIGLDVNPCSVKCARKNAAHLGFGEIIDIRLSDVFDALSDDEKFDVVTVNPPFLDLAASDPSARAFWDEDLYVHYRFFEGLSRHLAVNGRAYICQANFSPLHLVARMATDARFTLRLIGQTPMFDDIPEAQFLAFEIRRL